MNPQASNAVTAANVDLSNCDRELVQYSGAVQPHCVLATVSETDWRIVQLSTNVQELSGRRAEDLCGRNLEELLGVDQVRQVKARIEREVLTGVPVHVIHAEIGHRQVHVFAHRIDQVLVLEIEPANSDQPVLDIYSRVRAAISRLQTTNSLQAFFEDAVAEIRELTGFDRVMAYQFLADGSGRVTAESAAPGLESYLGLHYPASDIPQPARRLFALTWLRHLPNVDYEPVPLVPAANRMTGGPLDLSYVGGRHVSVMYSKYLQNMGVKATMVMTLLKNGQLWGLVSCMNHSRPMFVPYETRMACEFLAHMVSLLMAAKQDAENYEQRLHSGKAIDLLIEAVARSGSLQVGLTSREFNLANVIECGGAALLTGDTVALIGTAPTKDAIRELGRWLSAREEQLVATDALSREFAPAASYQDVASGLLATRLSRTASDFLMWFRPEIAVSVNWAGDPRKPVEVEVLDMETRLQPRTSFALWKEEVHGRSSPWQEWEVEVVRGFRHALMEVIIERAKELERLNRELEKSNLELDSFAYVASHDLKEPLRGIHNYSALLHRSASERLSDAEKSRLETVLHLTQRMDDLIESLLQYSRVGRTELALQPVDLNGVVRSVLDLLHSRLETAKARVQLMRMPTVSCDRVRVREVFHNLILNAVKYNDSREKLVEVGYASASTPVFYVRDNGIGIEPEHLEDIFQIFKRLHARDEYGGGTGAGLTIARRTVERHGGRMWVESDPGHGSTFYFTLSPSAQLEARA